MASVIVDQCKLKITHSVEGFSLLIQTLQNQRESGFLVARQKCSKKRNIVNYYCKFLKKKVLYFNPF